MYGSSVPSTAAVTGPFGPFTTAANGPGPFATPDQIFRDRATYAPMHQTGYTPIIRAKTRALIDESLS